MADSDSGGEKLQRRPEKKVPIEKVKWKKKQPGPDSSGWANNERLRQSKQGGR